MTRRSSCSRASGASRRQGRCFRAGSRSSTASPKPTVSPTSPFTRRSLAGRRAWHACANCSTTSSTRRESGSRRLATSPPTGGPPINREEMTPMPASLERATPASLDLDPKALDRLLETITRHIAEGRYPGAQIAMARRGKLALFETIGDARIDPTRAQASEDTLWLLYSNTKVVTACAVWLLVERGAISFADKVAEHLSGFEQNGTGDITIIQLLTPQGGFPNAVVPKAAWTDHDLLRKTVCAFTLEWTPGSRVHYHSMAAHWTAAAMIEAVTKADYRDFIRANVVEPLGLGNELFVGLPEAQQGRAADIHEPAADSGRQVKRADENNAEFRSAGTPGGGGYATARAMATFYQMMAHGGAVNGVRLLSPRMVQYVTKIG